MNGAPMVHATYPSLAGKRVLVTGGATGIGAAFVQAFADQGANVVFLDIADTEGRALAQRLAGAEVAPRYAHCDLTDVDALRAALAQAEADIGPIDVLINNAASDVRHNLAEVDAAYWDASLAVNLRHQFFCAQAVAAGMQARGQGVILNLGSISWHLALPNLALYMTAKAAIEGMTRGLARDLGPSGVRVNCIIPGAVRTPRQARLWHLPDEEARILSGQCLKQRVEVDDVAALALFLASDNAARCTGREYFVDAGWYGA